MINQPCTVTQFALRNYDPENASIHTLESTEQDNLSSAVVRGFEDKVLAVSCTAAIRKSFILSHSIVFFQHYDSWASGNPKIEVEAADYCLCRLLYEATHQRLQGKVLSLYYIF